jgi:hypothetical protein
MTQWERLSRKCPKKKLDKMSSCDIKDAGETIHIHQDEKKEGTR